MVLIVEFLNDFELETRDPVGIKGGNRCCKTERISVLFCAHTEIKKIITVRRDNDKRS